MALSRTLTDVFKRICSLMNIFISYKNYFQLLNYLYKLNFKLMGFWGFGVLGFRV